MSATRASVSGLGWVLSCIQFQTPVDDIPRRSDNALLVMPAPFKASAKRVPKDIRCLLLNEDSNMSYHISTYNREKLRQASPRHLDLRRHDGAAALRQRGLRVRGLADEDEEGFPVRAAEHAGVG